MDTTPTYSIDGAAFEDLEGFYDEIETKLLGGEPSGQSLDALDEILAGGVGLLPKEFRLIWEHSDLSRRQLKPRGMFAKLLEIIARHPNVELILSLGSAYRPAPSFDRSAAYATYARERVQDARAASVVGDATALALRGGCVDVAVSALAINFVALPHVAVSEMARVVRPGGCVAAYVWDYGGRMELIRAFWDAAVTLDPLAAAPANCARGPATAFRCSLIPPGTQPRPASTEAGRVTSLRATADPGEITACATAPTGWSDSVSRTSPRC